MANTPLVTFRCPPEIVSRIESLMHETGQTKTQVMVTMLSGLVPVLSLNKRDRLPPLPGIYLVFTSDQELLYLGKSDNLLETFAVHHHYLEFLNVGKPTNICWFTLDPAKLPFVESELLELIKPDETQSLESHNNVLPDKQHKLEQVFELIKAYKQRSNQASGSSPRYQQLRLLLNEIENVLEGNWDV